MFRGLVIGAAAVLALVVSASADQVIMQDDFVSPWSYNYWDTPTTIDTTFAHTGSKSIRATGANATAQFRADGAAPWGAKMNGNNLGQFWLYTTDSTQLDKILVEIDWTGGRNFKPDTIAMGYSTDGTNFAPLNTFNQIASNTWTLIKVDFASVYTLTNDSMIQTFGIGLNWTGTSTTKVWVDDAKLVGATPPVVYPPGDFTKDMKVTDADYTVWSDNYNQAVPAGFTDGNGDGIYTDADYTVWAEHYGEGTGIVVPEPATLSLLGFGLLGLIRRK